MSGGGFRASSIPNNLKNTIQNLKEITGNQNEEEIYAMLKECSMEPNETAQRLLLQGNFHEVKRKRDRKKESTSSRETADSRWKTGPLSGGGRGGRGNYSSRPAASDVGGGKTSASGKENGPNQASEKLAPVLSRPASGEPKNKESTFVVSSATVMANGPISVVSGGIYDTNNRQPLVGNVVKQPDILKDSKSIVESRTANMAVGTSDVLGKSLPCSSNSLGPADPVDLSGVCSSASDPVVVSSNHPLAGAGAVGVGVTKGEVGSQQTTSAEQTKTFEYKPSAEPPEVQSFSTQGKMSGKSQGIGKNPISVFSQPSSSSVHGGSPSSRPSSNYGSRSQQAVGQQKGPSKEWKPKATNPNTVQGSKTPALSDEVTSSDEAVAFPHPAPTVPKPEEVTPELEKKLEDLNIRDIQHVIIPNHIHVPEAIRTGLSFGSFDAAFIISPSTVDDSKIGKFSSPISATPEVFEEAVVEQAMSNQNVVAPSDEADCVDDSQSPVDVPEDASSGDADAGSALIPEMTESKEIAGVLQPPIVNTSPLYSFGLVPQMLVAPLAQSESFETQARDLSRIPGFAVPQPVDPASLYAQFYRPGVDSEGRISPFTTAGVSAKYGGSVAVLAAQTSMSPQEGTNSLVLSTSGQAALATQAAGLMQSSIAVTQQAVPVFRQPAGVHIPHYPPNYIPYGHYISPFYVPPPAIHQFLSSNAFAQQSQASSVYPGQPTAAATGVKYPVSQYKPGSNPGNIGVAVSYGPYGSSPAGYNPGSAATGTNSTTNEDVAVSQFKESNVYITGQQSDGSAVWVAGPGRDITGLQANTFYNLSQGQHVTLTPTQGGHGTFAGIYHPAQSVTAANVHSLFQQSQAMVGAVDMVGATAGIYQQPQHAQLNWPNNF